MLSTCACRLVICDDYKLLYFLGFRFNLRPHVKEPDILVADDDDVSRLKPGTVLEVNIKKVAARPALTGPPL
jgi:hypothetical protein